METALTVTNLPHVLAVLDAVDHLQENFFLLLNSSSRVSQSFNPVRIGKAKQVLGRLCPSYQFPSAAT